MHIVSGFILREVVGETVAIPSGDSAHFLSGLVALNETGAFLFRLLKSEHTEDSLAIRRLGKSMKKAYTKPMFMVEYYTNPLPSITASILS